ncbi:NAD(P)-dependent oxidoreductase [Candidatus Kaiserbacteria bacterium]|nr:NAD(P)-dependent oxidoreductase [Candidatus Kaiserbacteria bacterium]
MKSRTVLVTGASGFIGRNLVRALIDKKYIVHVLMRSTERLWDDNVIYHPVAAGWDFFKKSDRKFDAVVHLAGEVAINQSLEAPRSRIENNLAILLSLLEAVRASDHKPLIIFSSTDRMYGRTKRRTVNETEPLFPIEPYTASKIMGETALQTYAALYDIPYIALRFDSVYGPGQPRSMFISDVIQKMQASDRITTGPLTTKKNFVYVGDAVDAILSSIAAPRTARNQAYNIGGKHASFKQIVVALQAIFRAHGNTVAVKEEKKDLRPAKAEVKPFRLSTTKAERMLKWRARTSLYKGLSATIEYFHSL